MPQYILAFDQGTTSSRAVIFDENGHIISHSSQKHKQIYEHPGWVSHNAKEIFFNIVETGKQAIAKSGVLLSDIKGIGITNQRETTVAWDAYSGEPICNAIVWQCKRTSSYCQTIKTEGFEKTIREKTGLLADPYFSATKMRWILDNVPAAKILLRSGRLKFGTIDSYIISMLTRGRLHVTDYTNASRTMLFNIHTLRWDEELLDYFDIPVETLPEIVPTSGICGNTEKNIFGRELSIAGIAGDQHAAMFGQGCFQIGDVKNTYGTGCFILQNTGSFPANANIDGLLTTIAWHIGGKTVYAVEGSIFNAGSAIDWLINKMKIVQNISELTNILSNTTDNGGIYFVPAFSGLGAPQWDMNARAAVYGMTLGSGKEQFVRAVCESITYQVKDVLDYMAELTNVPVNRLKVDGGISNNNFIMQFQADMLNIPVCRPQNIETSVLGAACLAGLATGIYDGIEKIALLKGEETVFMPNIDEKTRNNHKIMWEKAVSRSAEWL